MDIVEFYKTHEINDDFDEVFYSEQYPETKNFHQPYCKNNNIDDRHRLFFHWYMYGSGKSKNFKEYSDNDPYFKPTSKYLDKKISLVVGCMNREDMLRISIHSWIKYDPIKEIIIVDWSSKKSIEYLENISTKIKVIRIEGKKYYNASTPVNIAIKAAKYPIILKLDVDYIINPYGNFNDLIDITEEEFICGNWKDSKLDNHMGFVKGTNGFLCVYKKHIENVGYYDESIENYGKEDCDMFKKLVSIGLKRKTLSFKSNNIPLYHNPHSNYYRTENFEEKLVEYNNEIYEPIIVDPSQCEYGFIHIPKTGGTSIIKFLQENYPENFICSRMQDNPYHSLKSRDISHPIAVVRCPFERFLSSFNYWKYGPTNGPWVKAYEYSEKLDISIDNFIELLKTNRSIINTKLTWYAHFHPQSHWIKEKDYKRLIVINYKEDLEDSMLKLIDYLKLDPPKSKLLKINQSRKTQQQLTNTAKEYIRKVYAKDFDLLEKISSSKDIFRFVI